MLENQKCSESKKKILVLDDKKYFTFGNMTPAEIKLTKKVKF